jgi:hypothetical protein
MTLTTGYSFAAGPYTNYDWHRHPGITEKHMLAAYYKSMPDHHKVFYGRNAFTVEDFKEWLRLESDHHFLCYHTPTEKLIGLWWINGIQGKSAYFHYIPMPDARLQFLKAGRIVTNKLLEYFDCLLGLIPETRPFAKKAAEMAGFKEIAVIPKGTYWAETDESINAHLLVKTEVYHGKKSVSDDANSASAASAGTAEG